MFGNENMSRILKNRNGNTSVNRKSGFNSSPDLVARKNRISNQKPDQQ